jgi:hypothetical protein
LWASLDVYMCLNVTVCNLLVLESTGILIVSDGIATQIVSDMSQNLYVVYVLATVWVACLIHY